MAENIVPLGGEIDPEQRAIAEALAKKNRERVLASLRADHDEHSARIARLQRELDHRTKLRDQLADQIAQLTDE